MSRLDALHERATGPLVDLPATTVVAITAGDLRGLLAVAETARNSTAAVYCYDTCGAVLTNNAALCSCGTANLRTALVRLDAVTGGETS